MDAFAVAVTNGLTIRPFQLRYGLWLGLYFALAQWAMPLLGYALGSAVAGYIRALSPYVSFCLLGFIGGKMLWEAAAPLEEGMGRFSNIDTHTAVIMLLATTLGVALSFCKKVRALPGSYDAGQYLILMFSLGMGLCFDLSRLGDILLVMVMVLFIELFTVALHLLFAKIARIDRDTMMITSVAGVFGPAFIIPVAKALKNDEIILPGILCGILGYAIGNYLGIGLGSILLRLCGA